MWWKERRAHKSCGGRSLGREFDESRSSVDRPKFTCCFPKGLLPHYGAGCECKQDARLPDKITAARTVRRLEA